MKIRIQISVVVLFILSINSSHGKTICETRYRNIHPEHSMCKARNHTCKFRQGMEENAKELLDLHNKIRKSIQQIIGKEFFEGKNMKNMQWDHELYLIAKKHVLQCTELPDCNHCHQTDRFHVEQNFAVKTFNSVNESFNGTIERFKIVIKEWAEELSKYSPEVVSKFHFIGLPTNWTNIFRATTNKVGCASIAYDTQKEGTFTEVYVCNYGPAILAEDEVIYEPVYTNCNNGLCKNQFFKKYGKNATYPFNGPSKRRKRSDAQLWSSNGRPSRDLADCPAEYRNITADHSYCKPNVNGCTFSREYVRYRRELLNTHNEIRNSVETYASWDYATATNMRVMEWDEELYDIAQRYVIQCLLEPDCHLCHQAANFSVEQNFAVKIISKNGPKSQVRFAEVVKEWAMELKNFARSDVEHLPKEISQRHDKHWINVFRARAWKVGCASISFETSPKPNPIVKEVYICNYGPAELSEGEEIYEIGESCSNCDPGFECDEKYPNLCSKKKKPDSNNDRPTEVMMKNTTTVIPSVTTMEAASSKESTRSENDIIADEVLGITGTVRTTVNVIPPTMTTATTTTTVPPTTMTTTSALTTTTTTTAAPTTMATTTVPTTTMTTTSAPTTTATTTSALTTAAPTTMTTTATPMITTATATLTTTTTTVSPVTTSTTKNPHRIVTEAINNVPELPFETSTVFPVTNKHIIGQGNIVWNCTLRFFNDEICRSEQQCYKAWTMSNDGKQPFMEIDMPENLRTALLFLHHIYIERPSCFTFSYTKDGLSSLSSLTSTLYGIVVRTESNEHVMVDVDSNVPVWNSLAVDIPWVKVFVQVGVAVKTRNGRGEQHIQIKDLLIHVGPCSTL